MEMLNPLGLPETISICEICDEEVTEKEFQVSKDCAFCIECFRSWCSDCNRGYNYCPSLRAICYECEKPEESGESDEYEESDECEEYEQSEEY